MHNGNKLIILAVLVTSAYGEDILSRQAGSAIAVNDWTLLSPAGYAPTVVGYDHSWYVPATSSMVGMDSYRIPNTEINMNWAAFSFSQNRFDVVAGLTTFHDEHGSEGGHSEGGIQVDPIFSMAYGPCCYSGSNAPENTHGGSYWFDFLAQVGINKAPASSLNVNINQPQGAFDPFNYRLVTFGGDGGSATFSEYTPSTNSWSFNVSTTGTCPITGLQQFSMAMNTRDKKMYIFGGSSGGTLQNTLFTYDPTSHVCAALSPSSPPSARQGMAFAYDSADNIFLMYGGVSGGSNLNDTWVYDPVANTWAQLSPAHSPASPIAGIYERMVYFPEEDVFVIWAPASGGQGTDVYSFRYRAGQNAGYVTGTYTQSPGSMNRNITGSPAWALGSTVASNGSTAVFVESESGGPTDSANSSFSRPYAQTVISGVASPLPNPSTYQSIAADVSTAPVLTGNPSITYVGSVPWACWHEQNLNFVSRAQCKGYSGGSWSLGGVLGTSCTSGNCKQGQTQIADVNGTPTVIWREVDSGITTPNSVNAFVKQWGGSSWTQLGGALNVLSGATLIDSVSIASNGTNPYAAWTEYTGTTVGSPPSTTYTAPQVYLYLWGGSSWSQQCSGSGNVSGSNRAYSVSMTYLGSTPYLAWVERTNAGYNSLYIRKCSGGSWSTVAGPINKDTSNGWAFRPELTNDGTDLYVTWDEQGNQQTWVGSFAAPANVPLGQRNQVYAAKVTTGGTVSYLGGSLNADTAVGSGTHPSIKTIASATPVVAWGEVSPGTMRQLYAKSWNGSNWVDLVSSACVLSPNALGPYTAGQVISQTFAPSGCGSSSCSISAGSLGSSGLSLGGGSNCVLSGTAVAGSYSFTVAYDTSSTPITVTINASPSITTSSPLPDGTVGSAYSQTITATGGTAPNTWSVSSGTVPTGTSLSSGGVLSGTPTTTSGSPFSFTVLVTDANSRTNSAAFTLTINGSGGGGTTGGAQFIGRVSRTGRQQ